DCRGCTGLPFGRAVGTARAAFVPQKRERLAWVWIFLGAVAWTLGQLFSDALAIARIRVRPPDAGDLGFLASALLFVFGCAAFLAGHQQRLAVYALVLDV